MPNLRSALSLKSNKTAKNNSPAITQFISLVLTQCCQKLACALYGQPLNTLKLDAHSWGSALATSIQATQADGLCLGLPVMLPEHSKWHMGLESFYVPDAKLSVAMSMNRESLIISFLFVLRWILTKSSVSSREALILDTSRANVCRGHQVWSPSSLFQPHFFSTRHFNSRFSKHVERTFLSSQ